jgi:hypothetical protein
MRKIILAKNDFVQNDYSSAGFNAFFNRSIGANAAVSLPSMASSVNRGTSREINYDQSQTSGSLGSVIKVGTIEIDGVGSKISLYEGSDEVVRIGQLDG